jgi:hypothetical protein
MGNAETKSAAAAVNRKVVIILQDHDAKGKVYASVSGSLTRKDVLIEALKQVEEGTLYKDKTCTQPIRGPFIEVFDEHRTRNKEHDFVFLIDVKHARDHVVAVQIV